MKAFEQNFTVNAFTIVQFSFKKETEVEIYEHSFHFILNTFRRSKEQTNEKWVD